MAKWAHSIAVKSAYRDYEVATGDYGKACICAKLQRFAKAVNEALASQKLYKNFAVKVTQRRCRHDAQASESLLQIAIYLTTQA